MSCSHECPAEYTCSIYIFILHIYAYINLSFMIVNLVCIMSNHHCVTFVISIECMHSIIIIIIIIIIINYYYFAVKIIINI